MIANIVLTPCRHSYESSINMNSFNHHNNQKVSTIIIFILQMENLNHTEIK